MLNSILWGNRVSANASSTPLETQQISGAAGIPNVTYCIVEGLSTLAGPGNQKYAPLFVNAGAGDYHLDPSSPAVNATQRYVFNNTGTDLDGLPRYVGGFQDLGAYELQGARSSTVYLTQAARSVSVPTLTQASFTFEGTFTFHWQIFDPATRTWQDVDPSSTEYQVVVNGSVSSLVITSAAPDLDGAEFRVRELPDLPVTLTVLPPQIFYVDGGVGSSGDGKSWAGAFQTVQEAVAASVAISANNSAEIWVKAGTYAVASTSVPLPMSWQVQLYGGFAGTETSRGQRDWVHHVTTFTSAGNGVIVQDNGAYSRGCGNSLLDGFTISGATQNGYSISQSSPVIRHCVFDGAASGVAVVQNASPTFQGCTFQNLANNAIRADCNALVVDGCTFQNNPSSAGVVAVSNGTLTLTNSRFAGNAGGPVLNLYGGTATTTISRCAITGNTTLYDLISLGSNISLNVDNTLIADNQTTLGSVIECDGPTVNINFCTIANNRHQGSAIGVSGTSQTTVNYSILWGNRNTLALDQRQQQGVTDLTTAQACLLTPTSGATMTVYRGVWEGVQAAYTNQNFGYDPLFANPGSGDYSLSSNSPAIGHGDSYAAAAFGAYDLAGNPRCYPVSGGTPDDGAYEYQSSASSPLQIYGDYGSKRVSVGTAGSFTFMNQGDPFQWEAN